jgi:hypothetical protein
MKLRRERVAENGSFENTKLIYEVVCVALAAAE